MGQAFLMGQRGNAILYATGSFASNTNIRVGPGFGHAITGLAFTPRIVVIGPYDQYADFSNPSKTPIDVVSPNDTVISIKNLNGETNVLPTGYTHITTTINGVMYTYSSNRSPSGLGLQQLVNGFSMIMPSTMTMYSWYAAT